MFSDFNNWILIFGSFNTANYTGDCTVCPVLGGRGLELSDRFVMILSSQGTVHNWGESKYTRICSKFLRIINSFIHFYKRFVVCTLLQHWAWSGWTVFLRELWQSTIKHRTLCNTIQTTFLAKRAYPYCYLLDLWRSLAVTHNA